ncbi:RBBP9/YdeN family alpha/beta hydrolase [Streptacidiphilus rugosus]|uniref:RBBP9/YdeN family alpha/beta hydrolase n=1 Tax=Streptacidiphilus rugosus TaxID=405783 RepID=UPI000A035323|nr:alpha/beta hydrolase [Streptacidiphilus rugosus]
MILPVPTDQAPADEVPSGRGAGGEATVIIVPGLRDHVADHWQTHLAAALVSAGRAVRTLAPLTDDRLSCAARVAALEEAVTSAAGPVVLVAHSAGVITTVHWARGHRTDQVRGALLATPPDLDQPMHPPHPSTEDLKANGWLPVPQDRLPFPSVVATSTDDPLAALDRVLDLARDWGSLVVGLGAVGHLNPASGYGPWPQAEELLKEFDRD